MFNVFLSRRDEDSVAQLSFPSPAFTLLRPTSPSCIMRMLFVIDDLVTPSVIQVHRPREDEARCIQLNFTCSFYTQNHKLTCGSIFPHSTRAIDRFRRSSIDRDRVSGRLNLHLFHVRNQLDQFGSAPRGRYSYTLRLVFKTILLHVCNAIMLKLYCSSNLSYFV